jgi:carboxyl-terminal processing protease
MRFAHPCRRPSQTAALVSRTVASGLLLCSILGAGCSSPQTDSAGDAASVAAIDRPGSPPATAYATFDAVWSTVDEQHFDPNHHGVDWDAVRAEYRPRVEETRSEDEVRRLLGAMLAELGQTHFVIIPQEAAASAQAAADAQKSGEDLADVEAGSGVTGLRFDWAGDDALVVSVRPDSPGDDAGVRPGWRLDRVDDFEPTADLAGIRAAAAESGAPFAVTQSAMILNARSTGDVGSSGTFVFTDGDGGTDETSIRFEEEPGERVGFGLLPPTPFEFKTRVLTPTELDAWGIATRTDGSYPTIVVTSFNIWMFPALKPMADAVDAHRDADGFIIDLRGNPGGVGGLAMGVAGHFMAEEKSLGDLVSRDTTMHFAVNPQKVTMDGRLVEPFAGPLAIVTDSGSASTSEVFAAGLQQLGRATVVGRPSAGAALPAHLTPLPNGDTFMYAIADFIGPAGHSIEGTGVIPDITVPLERERLLAEGDPDLATAARWICGADESN